MKKSAMPFLFLLLFIPEFGASQEPKQSIIYHSIAYEVGVNWLKDENLFPIVHRGSMNGLTYRFEKTGRNYNEVTATFRYGKLKAKPETEKESQNAQFSLSHCMGFRLLQSEQVKLFFGYNLKYSYSFLDFPVWDESRAYWGTAFTIGISGRLFIEMKDNQRWICSLDFNPAGMYSRPDEVRLYAQEIYTFSNIIKTTNSNFTPGCINNILLSNFRTEYRFLTKNDHYLSVQYSLSYSAIKKTNEHPLLNSMNNFGFSLGF
jgi:hypothetical protein